MSRFPSSGAKSELLQSRRRFESLCKSSGGLCFWFFCKCSSQAATGILIPKNSDSPVEVFCVHCKRHVMIQGRPDGLMNISDVNSGRRVVAVSVGDLKEETDDFFNSAV